MNGALAGPTPDQAGEACWSMSAHIAHSPCWPGRTPSVPVRFRLYGRRDCAKSRAAVARRRRIRRPPAFVHRGRRASPANAPEFLRFERSSFRIASISNDAPGLRKTANSIPELGALLFFHLGGRSFDVSSRTPSSAGLAVEAVGRRKLRRLAGITARPVAAPRCAAIKGNSALDCGPPDRAPRQAAREPLGLAVDVGALAHGGARGRRQDRGRTAA
jgi:hypothetical protein